jgi:microcystin-dependent protein
MYGGNGQTTFALPDLRGRVSLHQGSGFTMGQKAGEEFHTLSIPELPTHVHQFNVSAVNATVAVPTGNGFGNSNNAYAQATNLLAIDSATVTHTGGSQPHENRQPFTVLNVIIALQGIFPSQN